MATWCKQLTHWKRPWCWERLRAGGEGDDGGWDGWMASLTRWTWVWVDSGSWSWTGRPGVLWYMGSQRVRHDWVTELNWTEYIAHQVQKSNVIKVIIVTNRGFFFFSFWCGPFFKVFIEFVTILLLFYVFFWLWGMWDLSSLTRDQTCTPCLRKQSLNNWTTGEVPTWTSYLISSLSSLPQPLSTILAFYSWHMHISVFPNNMCIILFCLIHIWPLLISYYDIWGFCSLRASCLLFLFSQIPVGSYYSFCLIDYSILILLCLCRYCSG